MRPKGEASRVVCLLAFGALLAGLQPLRASSADRLELPLSVDELMREVRRTQTSDFQAWRLFAFVRDVVRQRLDADGMVEKHESLTFEIVPTIDGFDERLVEIDGRAPFSFEVDEHRRAGRFEKHYRRVQAGEGVDEKEGFSLAWLTRFPSYEFTGVERIDGDRCYRLQFGPAARTRLRSDEDPVPRRFLEVMTGSLCVDPRSFHLRHARARTLRPVPVSFGLIRILALSVEIDGRRVTEGVWLPAGIRVESHLSILGRDVRKRNIFTYSDYREVTRGARRSEIRGDGG